MKPHLPILAIVGPTAVGKSDVAMALARTLPVEIVVADSQQIYRGLNIGTSKPSAAARAEVPHHGLDLSDPRVQYTTGQYLHDVVPVIQGIQERGKIPLGVAGTGLYLRALMKGLWPSPPADHDRRAAWQKMVDEQGHEMAYQKLREVDPDSAGRIDPRNTKRVIRALEVFEQTGRTFSSWLAETAPPLKGSWLIIGLTRPRGVLRRRIHDRVEVMFKQGWVEEVKMLLDQGISLEAPGFQALGYREIVELVKGKSVRYEVVRQIIDWTRQYAKRQETWFRHEPVDVWFDLEKKSLDEVVEHCGLRISDFGFNAKSGNSTLGISNPQSAIRNPQLS